MSDLLERVGWSQAFLARHLGVDVKTVGRWCKGQENPVAMKYLEFVARTLGV